MVTVTLGDMITFSLGAPASRLAKVRHAAALGHVEAFLDAAQRGPEDLSHLEITSLLGDIHKALLASMKPIPRRAIRLSSMMGSKSGASFQSGRK
jgi:hypothetical protein